MGSVSYQDFYDRDVFLTSEELEFAHHEQNSLRIKPVWDDENTHISIRIDGSSTETLLGHSFIHTNDLRIDTIEHTGNTNASVLVNSGLSVDGSIQTHGVEVTTTRPYTNLSDNELVSKKQMNDYLLNYLTADVQFNNTTLLNLIEDALLNITLPDVQTEKITQVLNEYRENGNLGTDVSEIIYTLTIDHDTSQLITSNILDGILQDYVQNSYIPDLNRLNNESSRLFDYPMQPFYLRLEDYVSNYIIHNVPDLINAGNIVYMDYIQENYYTKDEILEGGVGGGGGNANIDVSHLLTKLGASEIYVKKSDFFTADGNVQLNYTVESNINVYNYAVDDIKRFVEIATTNTDGYRYTVDANNPNRITLTGIIDHTIDFNVLQIDDRVLIHTPILNSATELPDTVYNGVFNVIALTETSSVILDRAIDFKSANACVNAFIYVNSRSPNAVLSGNSYIVSTPSSVLDDFVINQDNIVIIPFIVQDNTHGSMAYQDHDNVVISGGSITVDKLHTSTIQAIESNFSIHIPAQKYFEITSLVPGEQANDAVFSVDEQGHVSAFQFSQMSDRSLKKNIQHIQNPLDIVNKLQGKTFEWKDEKKNKRGMSYGFIAQEIQQTLPEVVSETLSGHLTVDYTKVIPILTEAIKELYIQVQRREPRQPPAQREVEPAQREVEPVHRDHEVEPRQPPVQREVEPVHRDHEVPVYAPEFTSRSTTNTTIYVNPQPTETVVTTNVYSIGNSSTYFVNISSTNHDSITMEPLFISVENRQIYSLFSNSGSNTLDGVSLEIGDVVLVKNSADQRYNGVFKISGIQHVSFGRFSKCYRMDDFNTFDSMQHSVVVVSPSGFAGNGKGVQNIGVAFTCVMDVLNETSFVLDETLITFVSFGLNPQLGTMSMQDHTNVNITGGSIRTNEFVASNLFPYENNSTISLNLNGSTIHDTFQVRNESLDTIFSVDGTGRASAFEYYAPSDKNLKKNIKAIEDPLKLVNMLQGVTFDWKNKEGNHNYGFIAQDVARNFPSLVHKRSDGYLAVDYSKVVSVLVEAVKDISTMLKHA